MPAPAHADHVTPCATCGCVHPKCASHRKSDGQPCGGQPLDGHWVCRKHGGDTAQVRRVAAQNVAFEQAEALVTKLVPEVVQPITNPEQHLALLIGEMWAWKEACREEAESRPRIVNTMFGPQISAHAVLYERAMDRCAKGFAEAAKIGLAERLVRIEEADARRIFDAIIRGMQKAEVDTPEVRALIAAEIAALEAA